MEIRVRKNNDVVILELSGRIDVNSANLIENIGLCVRSKQCDVLCNFEEVDFVDYMGVSVIVVAYKEVINNNGRMKFCCVPAYIRSLFSISGLEKTFEFYPDEETALEAFKEDKIIEKIRKEKLRRRFKRLPIEIKARFKKKYETDDFWHDGQVMDLSAQGAYIYGYNAYSLNDKLELEIKLSSKPEIMKLDAKVVWLSDKQIQPQYHPGFGADFYNIADKNQKILLDFIEKNMASS